MYDVCKFYCSSILAQSQLYTHLPDQMFACVCFQPSTDLTVVVIEYVLSTYTVQYSPSFTSALRALAPLEHSLSFDNHALPNMDISLLEPCIRPPPIQLSGAERGVRKSLCSEWSPP